MYKRILIFGRSGAGKSTFALKLSQKIGLSLFHLDKYYFTDNWQKRNYQEYLDDLDAMIKKDRWIIEGNFLRSLKQRYAAADVVLYFDYPLYQCLWGIFKRLFSKDKAIDDRAPGCKERVSWELLWYTISFNYRKNYRVVRLIEALQVKFPHVRFVKVSSGNDLEIMLKQMGI